MSRLSGSGVAVDVPSGWEGRIYSRAAGETTPAFSSAGAASQEAPVSNAVLHVASFPLPPGTGDYGGGAVEHMTNKDLLVVLMEHGRQSVGTALFSAEGLPRLTPDDVSPTCLQRLIEGQGGVQRFFTANGRTFCLYVVFGSYARRLRTVPVVNDLLDTISIT
ncbi:MAG: hypothetical protein QOI95_1881 [Acidimicrobiaceae bacterium]|jgi:hypothetical protein